jgi:glycosyltransferase involved in cell wall biosynthesis
MDHLNKLTKFIKIYKTEKEIMSSWVGSLSSPMVTILCATYNHEKYIEDTVAGFLCQKTNFPFKILIRDDASIDNTPDLLREIKARYPNIIKVIYESENQYSKGINAFPKLAHEAKGKYIAMCDGDDYWTDPLKLQKQVDVLESDPTYTLAFCNIEVIYDSLEHKPHEAYQAKGLSPADGKIRVFSHPCERTSFADLMKGNYIHTPGVLFRNWIREEGLPDYMEKVTISDWPLHLFTAIKGDIFYTNEIMSRYRVHSGGIWSQRNCFEQGYLALGQYPPLLKSKVFDNHTKNYWLKKIKKNFMYLFTKASTINERLQLIWNFGIPISILSFFSLIQWLQIRFYKNQFIFSLKKIVK